MTSGVGGAMLPPAVLAVLAELAPAGGDRVLDVTQGSQPLVWLADADRAPRKDADRLAALDALHREERILHRGWGFLAGRAEIDGRPRKVRVPLLSQPVHLDRTLTGYRVVPAGDVEVTPLIADRDLAAALENAPGLATPGWLRATGSRAWLASAAEATGLTFDAMTEPGGRFPADRLVLVAGAALFVTRDVFGGGLGDSLRSWASRDLSATALAAIYGPAAEPAEQRSEPVISPLPLSEAQAAVVAQARTAPVTVVSGPPGNGKSHTVVAAALEVVHRDGSVLIATQSPHAAEVLAGLLARYPGPEPVLFGNADSRAGLAADLAAGAARGVGSRQLRADRQAVDHLHQLVRATRAELAGVLRAEQLAAGLPAWEPLLAGLAADVPGAFGDGVDLERAARLLGDPSPSTRPGDPAAGTGSPLDGLGDPAAQQGWWSRWRAASARRRLLRELGARPGVPRERVVEAIAAATARRAAARLAVTGGGDLTPRWTALHDAEAALGEAAGTAMRHAARSAQRWDADARRAASALATALRAGRNRRRELLARLDAPPLVRALPLWIGTVAEVEDLLPAAPGLFDLVVIDEASHVDQIRAAPVLARARRALMVGDPRQLRFVSFVSDAGVGEVLARHGADDRLDVRRVSAFDLAASAAPVTWLTEHHRSVPHLIGFSARRFYDGRIAVVTRTPAADAVDAIDVVRVSGASLADGVNAAEVAAAVAAVEDLAAAGLRGIGVITPFRAQADALESALVAAFPPERIEELGLRVGTVHAFQGSEADAVVVSLGLVDGDAAGRRRFVADAQLFNVMITRARRRMVVLSSLSAPDGLLGDYLAYAAAPGKPREQRPEPSGWAARLHAELGRLGVESRPDYAVGSWRLDLCAGPPESAVGVLCGVHPDGPQAHLARQSALHRAGWRLVDAFPRRWGGDPRRAALEIAARAGGPAAV
ncbi:AAA domain-containing protein [Actinoplanes sp. NEAU-A12]|uniref:AAA domain-containing protein n=1 Tax=Actinoplanes sandaracinus TaxID=3045177 RepID=A0ABT6WJQ3_9ACTN|nr:AAA domain-containing protein [Actinoplanes sandaracinus]MDI6099956.1 AAA domain-containing protein [Actinoplanes sandaracinus]